jgi:uncharacterized protein
MSTGTGTQERVMQDLADLTDRQTAKLKCYMSVYDIVDLLAPHEDALRAMGITSMAVFGSRATYRHRPDSDLDLLVQSDPKFAGFSLLDLARAQNYVQDLLHCETHMTLRDDVRPEILAKMQEWAIEVF